MIGITGEYVLTINIGDKSDIVTPQDLVSFKLIEEAGNVIPLIEIVLRVYSEDLIRYLNSNNSCSIGIGKTTDFSIYGKYVILNRERIETAKDSILIKLTGVYDCIKYINASVIYGNNETSFNIIKDLTSNFFKFESDLSNSNDRMNWWNSNKPINKFITDLWLHSNHANELPLLGITSSGVFRYLSLVNRLKTNQPDWVFTTDLKERLENKDDNYAMLDSIPTIHSNLATNNAVLGFPRSRIVHNIAKIKSKVSTAGKIKLLNSGQESQLDNIGSVLSKISFINENVHEKYYDMYDFNTKALLSLNNYNAKCVFHHDFKNIKVLDTVILKDNNFSGSMNSDFAGIWLVKKVSRTIIDHKLYTIVILSKDGINDLTT